MNKKVKLSSLEMSPELLALRDIDPQTVSHYRQAMRAGDVFPAMIADEKTRNIVCGHHRLSAYLAEFGEDFEVEVDFRTFKTELEMVRLFASDNARHGLAFSSFNRKLIANKLQGLGDDPETIAKTLGVPVKRVEEWAGERVFIIGNQNQAQRLPPGVVIGAGMPVKFGSEHMAGKSVSVSAYMRHFEQDRGGRDADMAKQLTARLASRFVDLENERTVAALSALFVELEKIFAKEAKKKAS